MANRRAMCSFDGPDSWSLERNAQNAGPWPWRRRWLRLACSAVLGLLFVSSSAVAAAPSSDPSPRKVEKLIRRILVRDDAEARAQILSLGSAALPGIREVLRDPACDPPRKLVSLLEELDGSEAVLVDLLPLVLPPSPYAHCKQLAPSTQEGFERAVLELIKEMGPRASVAFDTLARAVDSMPSLLPVLVAVEPTGERSGPVLAALACSKGRLEVVETSLDALPSGTLDHLAAALRAGHCREGVYVARLLAERHQGAATVFESLLHSPDAATTRLGLMLLARQGRSEDELVGLAARTRHQDTAEWLRRYQAIEPRSVLAISDVQRIAYRRIMKPPERYQEELNAQLRNSPHDRDTRAGQQAFLRDFNPPSASNSVPVTTPTVRAKLGNPSDLVDLYQIAIVPGEVVSRNGEVEGVFVSKDIEPCTLDDFVLEVGRFVYIEYELPEAHHELLTSGEKLALVVASAEKRPTLFLEEQKLPALSILEFGDPNFYSLHIAGQRRACRIVP